MMDEKIKNRLKELCSHMTFEYNGKDCGVDPISHTEFAIWCGDEDTTAKSIDEVMTTPFFDGKSLSEIADVITIDEW